MAQSEKKSHDVHGEIFSEHPYIHLDRMEFVTFLHQEKMLKKIKPQLIESRREDIRTQDYQNKIPPLPDGILGGFLPKIWTARMKNHNPIHQTLAKLNIAYPKCTKKQRKARKKLPEL